ncbi:MAG: CDP-alcohol phosphatidyltransferase family protein [Actinomyces sp.]|jgi:CDP-diacylglycerol--glycerol-3-phosphate 3-phosphatidyltransferase|nr:CDP-alcohol phosphatidyltransferase family protein [Actinomyces sp.]MCI1641060.1 CDP-alcohol phosphatidyltransferase family protein [Actinomyces sp.]MCI1661428.1 CDP-alcohol phosphatidyltransferase family protein [Actinomyces sp.]MCI1690436.1 CDP-alcohol phosphatidyltransferase family protein [Actinomyces sp.]MCI1787077.1 CDP-alcohol phosphatidyltransferase family protein [Actinomyces sp.]MCI1829357.1 CDP-alcohol phosphatidyltransferase family protein [Actinomyces sp.]
MLGNHGRSITRTIFTPLARALAAMRVTPNMVTVAGTVLTIGISVGVLARGHLAVGAIALGVVLFCDSVDGVLARLTGQESEFGAFLDSTLDRLGDGAVFGALLAWAALGMEPGGVRTISVIAGTIAMVGVGTVPYARARAESVGVVAKVGLAERTDRLVVALAGAAVTEWGLPQAFYAVGLSWVAAASLVTVIQRIAFTKRALEAA